MSQDINTISTERQRRCLHGLPSLFCSICISGEIESSYPLESGPTTIYGDLNYKDKQSYRKVVS